MPIAYVICGFGAPGAPLRTLAFEAPTSFAPSAAMRLISGPYTFAQVGIASDHRHALVAAGNDTVIVTSNAAGKLLTHSLHA